MLNTGRRNACLLGALQAVGIRVIAENDRQFEIEVAVLNGVDKCLQICARSGNQDCGFATTSHQTY